MLQAAVAFVPKGPPVVACHLPCRRGRFNAVMFWYKLHLYGDAFLSTGPEAVAGGGWVGAASSTKHWPERCQRRYQPACELFSSRPHL